MGSLTSRPQLPSVQQPQAQAVQQTSDVSADTSTQDAAAADASASSVRTQNLLQRSRGRLGTINTSFRGLLGVRSNDTSRKTLLGE